MSDWISVEDRLPEVPQGKYSVAVLAVQYDHVFEELSPGRGASVSTLLYDGENWLTLYVGAKGGSKYLPVADEVTHWMPLPEPPED